ncbi:hypothetical protein QBC46DRAFT_342813 [Diplogelasinospora grovesii]|uniref:Uncharacterized protein n=1 Tax=Diplogelasinospora grovesii TaxID=303347 RepID=A0AAN6S423_9PEZI|nr:hypothetical protein QBC46DRAFT_342813 [Diplogelasinospora grovesii]
MVLRFHDKWAFLINAGDAYFSDPVTKYVPELADATRAAPGAGDDKIVYDDINNVRWEHVTLGNLGSQAAGIARDGESFDIEPADFLERKEGRPMLNTTEVPVCGISATTIPAPTLRARLFFFFFFTPRRPGGVLQLPSSSSVLIMLQHQQQQQIL